MQDIQLYAVIGGELHKLTSVRDVNKTAWNAYVTVEKGEPFARWTHGGWATFNSARVSISSLRSLDAGVFLPVPIEVERVHASSFVDLSVAQEARV